MENQVMILTVMIIYIGLLVAWGLFQGRRVKTGDEYAIAGRRLPGWVAALSERATGESSWALLGLPGAAYATGLTEIWTAAGCVTGIIFAWILIARRLRDEAEKYEVSTFTQYLEAKHGDTGRKLKIVSGLAIVFFFFFYVGAQFLGGGKTLHTLFGIDPGIGVILTAAIIIPYTVYGGFRSVVYTDVVQAVVMIITLIIGPIAGIIYLRNNLGVYASNISEALAMSGDSYSSLTGMAGGFVAGLVIVGGFSWFFGYLGGQPQLSIRFMAIKDVKNAVKARNIGIIWTIIAYTGALMIGWIGLAIFGPTGLSDPEYVMPDVILTLFHPALAAVLITGAIAAMISTADSLLILSATELSDSVLRSRKNSSEWDRKKNNSLKKHRITTAVLAVVALGLSYLTPSKLIFTIVSYVWAGIGCTFSVVILLTLFWKKYNGRAALVTVISGILFTIIWISGGYEQHYRVTESQLDFLVRNEIINQEEKAHLLSLEGKKFVSSAKFELALRDNTGADTEADKITVLSTSFISKGIPARLTTFLFCLLVAVSCTCLFPGCRREDSGVNPPSLP